MLKVASNAASKAASKTASRAASSPAKVAVPSRKKATELGSVSGRQTANRLAKQIDKLFYQTRKRESVREKVLLPSTIDLVSPSLGGTWYPTYMEVVKFADF